MPRSGPHRYDAYARAHKGETADRMAARRLMVRRYADRHELSVKSADRKLAHLDVDHIKSIKGGGAPRAVSNLRWRSPHANRGDKTY